MEELAVVFDEARVYVTSFKFVKTNDVEKFKSEIKEIFADEPESLHPSDVHSFFSNLTQS